ncbi:MAG: hypothetical protein E7562_03415 [Ruminococcaceae bacterium]|nr:hypothetical protein [Oscillospiraceae bacterium]
MKTNTIVRIILVVVVLVFFGHQFYSSVYKPVTTETAVYYEMIDGLNITGTIIRNEYLVTCDTNGVYHYLTEDGSRVASGGVIANIYDNEAASITMSNIDDLTEKIKDMSDLVAYNNQQAADIDLLSNRVNSALDSLVFGCSNGNYSSAAANSDKLLSAINRRQYITGENTDFSARLAELNAQLGKLNSSLPAAKGKITATASGYFSSSTDGYETILTTNDLTAITAEFMKKLAPQSLPANVVGKIVSDYEWYIAAKMTINDSMKYKVGDKVSVKTALKTNPILDVSVCQINISDASDSAVVVFSCNQMSSELASMRTGAMTVVNKKYSGLKVAKSALRVVNSKTGVYVLSGITLKFVPVNVIYSNDEFMICEQQQTTEKALRLYDTVVIKGKNLYDGKVIG